MKMINLLIIFSAVFVQYSIGQISMGPLNINIIRAESCPSEKNLIELSLNNEKNHLTVNLNTEDGEFGADVRYTLRFDKIQNGQIQKNVFRTDGSNMCKDLYKYIGKFWNRLQEAYGVPTQCPVPAGTYKAENILFKSDDFAMKTFLCGRFLIVCELFREDVKVGCMEFEMTNNRPGESV